MDTRNPEVFEGKSFQELLKDIYNNSKAKKAQIKTLMDVLADMLKKPTSRPTDAAVIAPLVKDFLDVAVKNDEHLVKIATIIQRLMSAETVSKAHTDSGFLTDDEKTRLLEEAEQEVLDELKIAIEEDDALAELTEKAEATIEKVEEEDK